MVDQGIEFELDNVIRSEVGRCSECNMAFGDYCDKSNNRYLCSYDECVCSPIVEESTFTIIPISTEEQNDIIINKYQEVTKGGNSHI